MPTAENEPDYPIDERTLKALLTGHARGFMPPEPLSPESPATCAGPTTEEVVVDRTLDQTATRSPEQPYNPRALETWRELAQAWRVVGQALPPSAGVARERKLSWVRAWAIVLLCAGARGLLGLAVRLLPLPLRAALPSAIRLLWRRDPRLAFPPAERAVRRGCDNVQPEQAMDQLETQLNALAREPLQQDAKSEAHL